MIQEPALVDDGPVTYKLNNQYISTPAFGTSSYLDDLSIQRSIEFPSS